MPGRGLFGDTAPDNPGGAEDAGDLERRRQAEELLARARLGQRETLREATQIGNPPLYDEVLDALVAHAAGSAEALNALVAYILESGDLRSDAKLALALLEDWRRAPSRAALPRLLRTAALSGDAGVFRQAIETVFQFRRDASLADISTETLLRLCEGEYWLLSSAAKRSGEGFLVKEQLADMRRRMATPRADENPPSTQH